MEQTTLYYKANGSDKVYQVSIAPMGELYQVNFAYGRRGSALTTGTKTASPIPYDKAQSVYNKLVAEKMAKGYTPGADGTPFTHADKTQTQQRSGVLPQLLNAIDEDELEALFKNDNFWMQEKHDGKRIMLIKTKYEVSPSNRKGLVCGVPTEIIDAAKEISVLRDFDAFILDGELVGSKFFAFDLLHEGQKDLKAASYEVRYKHLVKLIPTLDGFPISAVSTAIDEVSKRAMFKRLKNERREGVVFKRYDSEYKAGRPAAGGSQLKFKFVATCTCRVISPNGTKRSIALELSDNGKWIDVGNCTISSNFDIPKAGDLVEIRYLYAYKGGSLYQPVFLGVRDDVDTSACVLSQLKYKADDDDEG